MKMFARILVSGSVLAVILALVACSGDDTAAPADAGTKRPDAAPIPTSTPDASPLDPDTGPPPTVLTSGEGYSIVYSAVGTIGVDGRPSVQAFFDSAGAMKEYYWSEDENLTRSVASSVGVGGDTVAGWGAWREGPTSGKWYTAQPDGRFSFAAGNDFHYAIGKKSLSAAWPTTPKTYALAGGTAPTADGVAEPGTLTAATATCERGPTRTCSITVSAAAAGGTIAISLTNARVVTGSTGTARVDANDPKGGITAMFAGDAADEIILVFGGPLTGGTSPGKTLRGAAVLK